ncbi:MAG: hypothetical protein AB7I30_02225 [Isosphaeraceae bacterium]
MIFTAYEGLLSWVFFHLSLIAVPAVLGFLVGRRGRLALWQVTVLVLLTALMLLPAVACVELNSRPESWFSALRTHARGSPGVSVLGMRMPGWGTMLVALSLGLGLGVALIPFRRHSRP